MIHLRSEGEPVKQGFNFYPLSDYGSFGFVFRLGTFSFRMRYSKRTKQWHIGH